VAVSRGGDDFDGKPKVEDEDSLLIIHISIRFSITDIMTIIVDR
jgi:hypothetical protein